MYRRTGGQTVAAHIMQVSQVGQRTVGGQRGEGRSGRGSLSEGSDADQVQANVNITPTKLSIPTRIIKQADVL